MSPRAPDRFATARLHAERFTEAHLPELQAIDTDPAVQATLFGKVYTEEESRVRLDLRVEHWRAHGFGDYIVRLADETFAGTGSLFWSRNDRERMVAMGYVLRPAFWGRGYATEIASTLLGIGFADLGLADIHAAADPLNDASIHVMRKLGMTFVREYTYGDELPAVLYRIERKTWFDLNQPR